MIIAVFGEDLDLFTFSKEVGKGLPLWLPNGTIIRDELEQWARQTERKLGYQRVVTPHITKEDLYYLSGHLPYYEEDLYAPIEIEGDSDGAEKPVVVIHRAPLGSHERFVAYLTEHFAGAFPVWLAPEQVRVIPIADDLLDYAVKVREVLLDAGLRVEIDTSDNRLNAKVRAAVTVSIHGSG